MCRTRGNMKRLRVYEARGNDGLWSSSMQSLEVNRGGSWWVFGFGFNHLGRGRAFSIVFFVGSLVS